MLTSIPTNEWFRPYESFNLEDVTDAIDHISYLGRLFHNRSQYPKHVVTREIANYKTDNFSLVYDFATVAENDYTRNREGVKIYYPVKQPKPEDIVRSRGDLVLDGFVGDLSVVLDPVDEGEIVEIFDMEVYPYGLFLRTRNATFYSIAPQINTDEPPTMVGYHSWKPYNNPSSEIGTIYVPADMPSLMVLEFKLQKLEPTYVYEQIPFF